MDLITSIILVPGLQFLQIACDVVGGSCVRVPIGVYGVGAIGGSDQALVRHEVLLEAVPADLNSMTSFEAYLTERPVIVGGDPGALVGVVVGVAALLPSRVEAATSATRGRTPAAFAT